MNSSELREILNSRPTVEVWPTAGKALGVSRTSAYAAAASGDIKVIKVGALLRVPSAWLKAQLGWEVV